MKKLLTLVALLTCFMGVNAQNWVEVYKVDYSKYSGFPFYVMGFVPEWVDGVMTDMGGLYEYAEVKADAERTSDIIVSTNSGAQYYKLDKQPGDDGNIGTWHQYFFADGIKTNLDATVKIVALVKASEEVTFNVDLRWSWSEDALSQNVTVPASDDFVEVEWEYNNVGGNSCALIAQPNTAATIEWKSVTVYEDQANVRPVKWQQWLTNDGNSIIPDEPTNSKWMGDAETPWGDLADVAFNDQTQNYLICAWGKERMRNLGEPDENGNQGWNPFPCDIEQEENGNHYFVVHGKEAITDGDASAWDNQFWIQSPREWKAGTQIRIKFRCKASKNVTVATQCHKQNPSDYLIWHAIGDVAFTTEWEDFENTMTIADDMVGTWSIAFQLNQNDKEAIDFYFDDLSWETMVLDEGLFVAGQNTKTGLQYDFDNAVEFEYDDDAAAYAATIGTVGQQDSWVNEIMISTIRGNDAAFKSGTIKPSGSFIGSDESGDENWGEYTEASLAKIKLTAAGAWRVYVDTDNKQIHIEKLDGEPDEEVKPINPNPSELVVNALERQYTESEGADVEGLPENIGTEENPWGQPWDNQFWIMANRTLSTGEVTTVKFKYRSTIDAKVSTQCHSTPGNYLHWAAIGDVNFVGGEEWQEFENTFTVASEANNMQSIAFNMAEIKAANDYVIKDVIWMTEDGTESLINETGTENFYYKVVGGAIIQFGQTVDPIKGDVNGDGAVNVADISAIISVMAGTEQYDYADVNGDGAVNVADISKVISIMAGTDE